jgi:hypothetical protein
LQLFYLLCAIVVDPDPEFYPDSMGSLDPDPYPEGQKGPTNKEKSKQISFFEVLDIFF